jgi:hypothetical protein
MRPRPKLEPVLEADAVVLEVTADNPLSLEIAPDPYPPPSPEPVGPDDPRMILMGAARTCMDAAPHVAAWKATRTPKIRQTHRLLIQASLVHARESINAVLALLATDGTADTAPAPEPAPPQT